MTNIVNNNLIELDFEGINIACPLQEGHRMVPVKTVCQIIDVDFVKQNNWLKKHEYFAQLYNLGYTTGADGKQYEMRCLPMFDLLSWLSSITDNQRKEGSKEKQFAFMAWLRNEMLSMYKLIEVFQEENKYELDLIEEKYRLVDELDGFSKEVSRIKNHLKKIDSSLEEVRSKRFTGQTALPFPKQ